MTNLYRVFYKKGDLELKIESSDKDYIDAKLQDVLRVEGDKAPKEVPSEQQPTRLQKTSVQASNGASKITDRILVDIIASINDAENYDGIAKNVLDKSDRSARILMCYYFAHKHPADPPLTTTHVERITTQLGVKIASANVAKVIREGASQYLTGDRVRKQRFVVHYKINRRGVAAFEKAVRGEAL